MTAPRRRLDAELVRRGLATGRDQAKELIEAGMVVVSNAPATKPSRQVAPDEPVRVLAPPPRFVGRGGEKLAAALEAFGIEASGVHALDAGASTGGFTDALLQAGAATVVAVDVGRAQLHERLRADPRVVAREQTDIRAVSRAELDPAPSLVVADLSFISLRSVVRVLLDLAGPTGELVVLVKPQFEAGRAEVSRGRGVIRDPEVWHSVLDRVAITIDEVGAVIMGAMVSPLRGAEGNVEFLIHVRPAGAGAPIGFDPGALVAAAQEGC